jgi:acetyltransferase-like isoleucine patch superfamily enzyme
MQNYILGIIESFIRNIGGSVGRKIRYTYYTWRLGGCGRNVVIDIGVVFENPKFIFLGDNVWIDHYTILIGGSIKDTGNIQFKSNIHFEEQIGEIHLLGENHIAPFAVVQGHGGIQIGAGVTIASGAKIYTLSHHYRNTIDLHDTKRYQFSSMAKPEDQFYISGPVVIGSGAAVGLNSVVMPGTYIPPGTWIGVSTTVTGQNMQENAIYVGTAATLINKD